MMAPSRMTAKANHRHDRFVEEQLRRAVRRIRQIDLLHGALGLGVIVLGYALVMMLADRWLHLPPWLRQGGLIVLSLGLVAYVWSILLKPIRRAVNPYYAAIQVERTIENARNSVVNWLDLHDDEIAPSIKAALGQRAAEDLRSTDIDQAIQSRRSLWLACGFLALVAGLLICFLLFRADQFRSLLVRTFQPFGNDSPILKQTRVTVVEPAGGNVTVATHQSLRIVAHLEGRIPGLGRPDSPRVLLRYSPDEPFEELPLDPLPDSRDEYGIVLPPKRVRTGFWYKVAAGDDETPEYRVQVRAAPTIVRFDALHTYRPYLRCPPRRSDNPNIEDYRGTVVTLDAVTNRRLVEGKLVLESQGQHSTINGLVQPDRPDTIRFQIALEKDAKYRVFFTTSEGESNPDSLPYTIRVLSDAPPEVKITKPEQLANADPAPNNEAEADLVLPADGMLRLGGVVQDDFGIQRITLQMRLSGRELKPQPYLAPQNFVLETGGYMRSIDYKDDVDLLKLESPAGLKVQPKSGQILEFWLEAEDNCDYPAPQVGRTRTYRVRIARPRVDEQRPPRNDVERQEAQAKRQERDNERQQAAEEKREHEKKHEQDRQQQSEKDRQQQQERQQTGQEQENRDQQAEQPSTPRNGDQGAKNERPADNPADSGQNPMQQTDPTRDDSKGDSTAEKIEKIKQELAREQQSGDSRPENKSDPDSTTELGGESNKPSETKPQPMNNDAAAERSGESTGGDPKSSDASKSSENRQPSSRTGDSASESTRPEAAKKPDPADQNSNPMQGGKAGESAPNAKLKPGQSAEQSPRPGDAAKPESPGDAGSQGEARKDENQRAKPQDSRNTAPPSKTGEQGEPSQGKASSDDPKAGPMNQPNRQPKAGDDAEAKATPDENKVPKPDRANQQTGDSTEKKSSPAERSNDGSASEAQRGSDPAKSEPGEKTSPASDAANGKPMAKDGSTSETPSQRDNKSGSSRDSQDNSAPRQPDQTDPEIDHLAEQMKKGDAPSRQAARERLEQMARSDPNPETRAAARRVLEQGQDPSAKPEKHGEPLAGQDAQRGDRTNKAHNRAESPKQPIDSASPDGNTPGQSPSSPPMKAEPAKAEKGEGSEAGADTKPKSDSRGDARGAQQPQKGQGPSEKGKSDSASPQPGAEGKTDPSGATSNKPSDASKASQGNAPGNQGSQPDSSAGQDTPRGD
ncbi:MAG: hypothetical protein N2039_13100, partial [Gemmataceae bacterium]|nr:hypothetical protein [Gemmataceae bacterium]